MCICMRRRRRFTIGAYHTTTIVQNKNTHTQTQNHTHRQTNTFTLYLHGALADWPTGARPFGAGGRPYVARVYPTTDGRTDGRTQTHSFATASRRSGGGGGVCIGNEVLQRVTRRLRTYTGIQ